MTVRAIAHGRPLASDLPADPAVALRRALAVFPEGRFALAGPDGVFRIQTYRDTWKTACRLLAALQARSVRQGDPLVIHVQTIEAFLPSIWAALLGGWVAVPLTPHPKGSRRWRQSQTVLARVHEAFPAARVLSDVGIDLPWGDDVLSLPMLLDEGRDDETCDIGLGATAGLIVPTSGTTGQPNLVQLNAAAVVARWWPVMPDPVPDAAFLSWSPVDHIMGLGVAAPNLCAKAYLAPELFARTPGAWLDAIERLRVTHATMTNFGMGLVLKAMAETPERRWDLSSMRKIGVGAEAIAPDLCARFIDGLGRFGLRPDAVILGYGLTECGPVAGGRRPFGRATGAQDTPFPVLDGPTPGHSIRITGEAGQILDEPQPGAVEVRGPTMTAGYLGDAEGTARLLTADGWLRTGDRGWLDGGQLTIVGREKEMITVNARKYGCVEIEACVRTALDGVDSFVVPLGLESGAETAPGKPFGVFVVRVADDDIAVADTAKRVRHAVAAHYGFVPTLVMTVTPDAVPRTGAGKIQRLRLLDLLGDACLCGNADWLGRAQAIAPDVMPATPVEETVAAIWTKLLGQRVFGRDDDFFERGGDSIAATQLVLELEKSFGRPMPPDLLHARVTVSRLAAFLEGGNHLASQPDASAEDQSPHGSALPAGIEQRLVHFLKDWPGEPVVANGLVRRVHSGGRGLPLFFCVQTAFEAYQLGVHLGPERPVYALRSGFLAMTYDDDTTPRLARRYVDEIKQAEPAGPYVIGGTCQGALVALEVARQLQREGRMVRLLALMDTAFWTTFQGLPYAGPVACFAGNRSRFNPYRQFRAPQAGWRKLLPGGSRVTLLEAEYGRFFTDDAMRLFVPRLAEAIVWSEAQAPATIADAAGLHPTSTYSADIAFETTMLTLAPGEQAIVSVVARNSGSTVWRPFDISGFALGNHWLRPNGEIMVWADGRTTLSQWIEPHQAVRIKLPIQAPHEPGDYLLEADLVEEGVTWFGEWMSHPGHLQVRVR